MSRFEKGLNRMNKTHSHRLLKTIHFEKVDATPIWIMRQAGRYLPEYRATRKRAGSFMQLCKSPEFATEVTLQPLARYELDAAIIFSDILTIPDAMGMGLEFVEGMGPRFKNPLTSLDEINRLSVPDRAELEYVYEAIKLTKKELADKVPLIGFCGSPFTLAAYMLDGQSKLFFPQLKKIIASEPKALHQLLKLLARAVSEHLKSQIAAGADLVMLFDTWGGLLDVHNYQIFSLHYLNEIMQMVRASFPNTPIILFTKGGNKFLADLIKTDCNVLGLDWEMPIKNVKQQAKNKFAVQGNLNPNVLLQSPQDIRAAVRQILADFGTGSGHIFNLGHGITPDVPPENVKILVDAVHELSEVYHLD